MKKYNSSKFGWANLTVSVAVIAAVAVCIGCATPVGVNRVNESAVYRQIDSSALTSDSYSSYTAVVLHRHGFQEDDFVKNPAQLIKKLHEIASHDERRDLLLTLSELCFLAAKQSEAEHKEKLTNLCWFDFYCTKPDAVLPIPPTVNPKEYYLGSAVYAYLFILGPGNEPPAGSFDRRFRLSCDLYNRSLTKLLNFVDGKVDFKDKSMSLPVGNIYLSLKTLKVPWDPEELEMVLAADSIKVHGLSVRNRVPGFGAPIIAVRKKTPKMPVSSAVPATIFLEIKGGIENINDGNCAGEVSILSTMSETEIVVGDKNVPLEADLTAPIAYSLNDPILWSLGWNLFRMGRSLFEPGIYSIQPHEPGLIPIVLVHGTMSSPVWWSEMLNTLMSDPKIRRHFQIWLYLYDSGKPVVFSADHLRRSIENRVKHFDPDGLDPALQNIVVIGHSQGGLLTRCTSIETGDAMVKAVLGKSLAELDLSPKETELVNRYAVYHPLPEVRRVVFISTPHRGSILAGSFAQRMAARFIALPREVLQTGTELLSISERFSTVGKLKWSMARTSIDSMSPDNPSLLAMAKLPVPPGIKAHSIIAIKGDEQPPEGDDGVVTYESAHLEGVESEMVVRDSHSCQSNPLVIEEVRRILIEHLHDSGIN